LRNREDAEDALQDGLLSAYLNLKSFAGRSRFSTWITRIVLNSALMNRRRARVSFRSGEVEAGCDEVRCALARMADWRPDPETAYSLLESRELLKRGIGEISPLLRTALYLSEFRELSMVQSAATLGVKVGAMKSRRTRARRHLAGLLNATSVAHRLLPPSGGGNEEFISSAHSA
jgi:RNA polymerase sigma-70 factor (ECF subfamily)